MNFVEMASEMMEINGQTINSGDVEDIEVNYIEVESVSLSNVEATSNNTTIPHKPLSTKSSAASSRVVGYEEPLRVNLLECKMSVGLDKKCLVQKDSSKSGMSYSECDNSDDSESNIYVNEDILKPCADSIDTKEELIVDLPENTQYINLENVIPDDLVHSTDKSSNALEKKSDHVVPGHEYINLPAPGTSECANTVSENVLRKDVILTVGPESEQKPKETASGTNDTETTQTLHQDENLKVMKKSISSLEKSMIKPEFDNSECNEDSSVVLKDKTKLIENISLPIKADDSESSDENEDGDTTTSSDQAKLL
ncbi:uncharacterized protein LOC127865991 isoform X1 [Dreissena polymorpha]|nr:uncharacterized protein LOC127865991 isoform X1 [Dreissena polymorpha]XP_052262115.1 uncharacterized protein LOC127865991 isoform X1 [Dreissena polymorpha]XP_052262116.1 uncharacterized protein LOC127865991 isoform X1 [Dreissena polymorpha]XP_052262117.1 uncharacterized protein LOC127865991 isoform X1 [Dreissena polymorpha]XP_052262118.1 uncharacterized protein LOC127865991 isoform X1 [Dreissena polymorpha]XP_052262119.1 uncharacterized protein LOC127865991 isoform X1 [Dreissena polymorpha]